MKTRFKSMLSWVLTTVRRLKELCVLGVWPPKAYGRNILRMERTQSLEEGTSFKVYHTMYFQLYELGL